MSDKAFELQLKGWRLTTAEIMYRMPDYRSVLQTFIWQDYDLAPKYPRLTHFLDFWSHNLDGPLASVRVAHAGIVTPVEFRHVGDEWVLQ